MTELQAFNFFDAVLVLVSLTAMAMSRLAGYRLPTLPLVFVLVAVGLLQLVTASGPMMRAIGLPEADVARVVGVLAVMLRTSIGLAAGAVAVAWAMAYARGETQHHEQEG